MSLDPDEFDAWVTERLSGLTPGAARDLLASISRTVWLNGRQLDDEPGRLAAISLGQARIAVAAGIPQTAQSWLDCASVCAEKANTVIDTYPGVEALRQAIDTSPQVIGGRFTPDPASPMMFAEQSWVRCGRCGAPGVVNHCVFRCSACAYSADGPGLRFGEAHVRCGARCGRCGRRIEVDKTITLNGSPAPEEVTARCPSCRTTISTRVPGWSWKTGTGHTDPAFGMPLLLQAQTPYGVLFAYNARHLSQLRCYVEAKVRDERHISTRSWSYSLPTWVKAAKNREQMLKAIAKLEAIPAP